MKTRMKILAGTSLLGLLSACSVLPISSSVTATPTRPQLSAAQAKQFSYLEVMKYTGEAGKEVQDPWDPLADGFMTGKDAVVPDYVVDLNAKADGKKVFTSVQEAVNQAAFDAEAQKRSNRIYIEIKPGIYKGLLYVPALESGAAITLYSREQDAQKTVITAAIDAGMPGDEYIKTFNDQDAVYKEGRTYPAIWAMYQVQAKRGKSSIGTSGSAMVWVKNAGFQAKNLTLANAYNEDRVKGVLTGKQQASGNHQAVAFLVDAADKIHVDNVRFLGHQDTFYAKSGAAGKSNRVFVNNSYVEGDVDFIFGRSTMFFRKSEIKSLGARSESVFATAPSTNLNTKYGIVFDDCDFTSDGLGVAANRTASFWGTVSGWFSSAEKEPVKSTYLGRQWFEGSRCSPYGETKATCVIDTSSSQTENATLTRQTTVEAVGKVVVMNSRIGPHINAEKPWMDWSVNPKDGAYRLVQFNSDDFFRNLEAAGKEPAKLYPAGKPTPSITFLSEFNNTQQ